MTWPRQVSEMAHFWQISLFDHVMDKNHNKAFLRQTVAMVTGYLPYSTFAVLEIHNLCHILLLYSPFIHKLPITLNLPCYYIAH